VNANVTVKKRKSGKCLPRGGKTRLPGRAVANPFNIQLSGRTAEFPASSASTPFLGISTNCRQRSHILSARLFRGPWYRSADPGIAWTLIDRRRGIRDKRRHSATKTQIILCATGSMWVWRHPGGAECQTHTRCRDEQSAANPLSAGCAAPQWWDHWWRSQVDR